MPGVSMKLKRRPLKPDQQVGAVVFPGRPGPVRYKSEPLPRDKTDLELAIGRKFIGALHDSGIAELSDLKSVKSEADLADLLCRDADGNRIGLQITELVDSHRARLDAVRKSYVEKLNERHATKLGAFSGCRVALHDDRSKDLPKPDSQAGRTVVGALANHLLMTASRAERLPVGRAFARRFVIDEISVSCSCERFYERTTEANYSLEWAPLTSYRKCEHDELLLKPIRGKLNKHYAEPHYEFWLIVYSIKFFLSSFDTAAIARAAGLLDSNTHPFDEVWFLTPVYHRDRDLGDIKQIWSRHRESADLR